MRIDIPSPPYEEVIAERLSKFMPADSDIEPLKELRMLIGNHPSLSDAMFQLAWFFVGENSTLDVRTRELVASRTCAKTGCEYEWGVHQAAFAEAAGFSPEQQAATVQGSADEAAWPERDKIVLRAVDELIDSSTLSDQRWQELRREYTRQQILEMLVLVGWYTTTCYMINATEIPLESWAQRFPSSAYAG
jgi:alkylhydroperoxidase family enzyme